MREWQQLGCERGMVCKNCMLLGGNALLKRVNRLNSCQSAKRENIKIAAQALGKKIAVNNELIITHGMVLQVGHAGHSNTKQ